MSIKMELVRIEEEFDSITSNMNKMLRAFYELNTNCYTQTTYTDLCDLLKKHDLSERDISELDFSFLREIFMQEHNIAEDDVLASYDNMDESMFSNYSIMLVRGVHACPICGKMHSYSSYKTESNSKNEDCCSEVCWSVAHEE